VILTGCSVWHSAK